ncbi:cysteine and histidine-rich domain-containing protein isoform X2 [Venturia canescens]|uniref:cysteine and histidine-rich domain-containing protein isoform X2 n=1 Tax=Venturia canescens TaxID=32260 RepID=UPI001C9C2DA5|nr:cysteine and histidine-rich domain-containing protein isoform X2 [Venturia canescens]
MIIKMGIVPIIRVFQYFMMLTKPPEPEKAPVDKPLLEEVKEIKPLVASTMKRPAFESPRTTLVPTVSPSLLDQIKGLTFTSTKKSDDAEITMGQNCYNKACKATYRGTDSLTEVCTYHPGVPIFHEGLKSWSCCQKRSTDFSVFLAQPGCTEGIHQWIPPNTDKQINCRMDWHQTGSYVVISIFGKKYQPDKSTIKLNPIRLSVDLFFIEENSRYNMDIELRGIVDVEQSSVSMLPTKVEIKLKKAEPGSWSQLSFPQPSSESVKTQEEKEDDRMTERVEAVDLSDL